MTDRVKNRLEGSPCCPYCDKKINGFGHLKDNNLQPRAGDYSVCFYCVELLIFDTNQTIRKPVESDLDGIDLMELQKAQGVIRVMHALRANNG